MRRVILLLLLVALLSFGACGNSDTAQSSQVGISGFLSPEDAVIAYLEGLRDTNLEAMMSAFAVEAYVAHFDLQTLLERLGVYQAHFVLLPNANELVREMNVEMRRSHVTSSIRMQYLVLTHPDRHTYASVGSELDNMRIEEDEVAPFLQDFYVNLNAATWNTLEIQGFISLEWSEWYREVSERYYEALERRIALLGAEQMVGRIAVFSLDGDYYLLFADLAEYDGRWYINEFGGIAGNFLANVPGAMQGIMAVGPAEGDAFFDEISAYLITEW